MSICSLKVGQKPNRVSVLIHGYLFFSKNLTTIIGLDNSQNCLDVMSITKCPYNNQFLRDFCQAYRELHHQLTPTKPL